MESAIAALFLHYSTGKLDQMDKHLAFCLGRLSEDQIWFRAADHENSVGNLVLHLCGNMRQWIIHGVGGEPDVRVRDKEFSAPGGYSAAELTRLFHDTVEEAKAVLATVPPKRLVEIIHPQGREVSVLDAIYQVVGHVQMHLGQIILLTKHYTEQDLDLTIPRPR